MSITLSSHNVNGLNSPCKRALVWRQLSKLRHQIVCLQETHLLEQDNMRMKSNLYPHRFFAGGGIKKAGVAVFFSKDVIFQLVRSIIDPSGRSLIILCLINNAPYTIASVYAPNTGQIKFMRTFLQTMRDIQHGHKLIAGDFNLPMSRLLDCSAPSISRGEAGPLVRSHGLHDIWRYLHCNERDYTFMSARHATYSRIDYILVDDVALPHCTTATIGNISWSDHAPVTVSLTDPLAINPPSRWRLNTQILSNQSNTSYVEDSLKEFFLFNDTQDIQPETLWFSHKAVLRGHLIKLAALTKRKYSQAIRDAISNLTDLENRHKLSPSSQLLKDLTDARLQVRQLLVRGTATALRKSKANFYSMGDRAGTMLARRVKKREAQSRIPFLSKMDSSRIYNPIRIADEFASFYSDLYNLNKDPLTPQPSQSSISAFLEKANLPTVDPVQLSSLNSPIQISEILHIIKTSKKKSAPGPDGFSFPYYAQFAHILSPYLQRLFEFWSSSGSIKHEGLEASIATLPKPGKPPTAPGNFRPIALLNVDVKIYAKLWANRLLSVLPSLVHPDQVGFVSGRQTRDGTRRLIDLLDVVERGRLPSAFLSLDAEKAFDRVHWGYLQSTLTKFGLTGLISNAIMALYSNPNAFVCASGFKSRTFKITNGTRQGCPLSPLVFALIMEPLAAIVRQSPDIRGIPVGSAEYKISLYADDVVFSCTDPPKSLAAISSLLQEFSAASYYKLNLTKSTLFPFMLPLPLQIRIQSQYPFLWAPQGFNYLGIRLTRLADIVRVNCEAVAADLRADTRTFSGSLLSWMARIQTVKMMLLPKLLYLFRCLPLTIPSRYISQFQSIIDTFIWNSKPHRVKKQLMVLPLARGGMGVPNLSAYHKAALLEPLKHWWEGYTGLSWLQIEASFAPHGSLKRLLEVTLLQSQPRNGILRTMSTATRLWSVMCPSVFPSVARYVPLDALSDVIDSVSLSPWKSCGILHIIDLFQPSGIIPFKDLQTKFNLPDSALFTYLQLHSLLRHSQLFKDPPPIANSPAQRFFKPRTLIAHGVSVLYDSLLLQGCPPRLPFMDSWENILSFTAPLEDWHFAMSHPTKFSSCLGHLEQTKKVNLQWYMTPARLARYHMASSSTCWKGCGSVGTLAHVWWECPRVSSFWRQVESVLLEVTRTTFTLTSQLALLGISLCDFPSSLQPIISNILVAARQCIATHWKNITLPSKDELLAKINLHYCYESLTASSLSQKNKILSWWDPWTSSPLAVGIHKDLLNTTALVVMHP